MVFNEADGKSISKSLSDIKDGITRQYNVIKEKYVNEPFYQKNLARIVFLTNQNSIALIEYNDRRVALFRVSDIFKGNTEFWNSFHGNLNNDDKLDDVYTFLMNRDISQFDPEKRPLTTAYKIAKSCSVPLEVRYLKEAIIDNSRDIYGWQQKKGLHLIKAKELYKSYDNWAVGNHLIKQGEFKSQSFKKALLEFKALKWEKKFRTKDEVLTLVAIDKDVLQAEFQKYTFDIEEDMDEIIDLDTSDEEEEPAPEPELVIQPEPEPVKKKPEISEGKVLNTCQVCYTLKCMNKETDHSEEQTNCDECCEYLRKHNKWP